MKCLINALFALAVNLYELSLLHKYIPNLENFGIKKNQLFQYVKRLCCLIVWVVKEALYLVG